MDQSFLTAPHSLSQSSTSFIASTSQGIHHLLLVAYLFYFSQEQSSCFDEEFHSLNPPKVTDDIRYFVAHIITSKVDKLK